MFNSHDLSEVIPVKKARVEVEDFAKLTKEELKRMCEEQNLTVVVTGKRGVLKRDLVKTLQDQRRQGGKTLTRSIATKEAPLEGMPSNLCVLIAFALTHL